MAATIDWESLRSDYGTWRATLAGETYGTLAEAAKSKTSLASLNALGVYHKVRDPITVKALMEEYSTAGAIPDSWISKGTFPGIWCALFNPHNTYSRSGSLQILRFTFKAEYHVFDPELEEHQKMWSAWTSAIGNSDKPNPWAEQNNDRGTSLADRMHAGFMLLSSLPNHVAFYREHKFGAVLGCSDYISLIAVLPESIEKAEIAIG